MTDEPKMTAEDRMRGWAFMCLASDQMHGGLPQRVVHFDEAEACVAELEAEVERLRAALEVAEQRAIEHAATGVRIMRERNAAWERIAKLEARVAELEGERSELEAENIALTARLREVWGKPSNA